MTQENTGQTPRSAPPAPGQKPWGGNGNYNNGKSLRAQVQLPTLSRLVRPATVEGVGATTTLIVGGPGLGKTRLAATWPNPLIFDAEHGAASANAPYIQPERNPTITAVLEALADKLAAAPFDKEKGVITVDGIEIGTIVVDTVDALQVALKEKILGRRTKMEQQDWGTLQDELRPAFVKLLALPIHKVFISHAKADPSMDRDQPGRYSMAIQGGLRDWLQGEATMILYLVQDYVKERGEFGKVNFTSKRLVYFSPVVRNGMVVGGKDRHRYLLGKYPQGYIAISDQASGYPAKGLAQMITSRGLGEMTDDSGIELISDEDTA